MKGGRKAVGERVEGGKRRRMCHPVPHQRSVGPLQVHDGGPFFPVEGHIPVAMVTAGGQGCMEVVVGARQDNVHRIMCCPMEVSIRDVQVTCRDFVMTEQDSLWRE